MAWMGVGGTLHVIAMDHHRVGVLGLDKMRLVLLRGSFVPDRGYSVPLIRALAVSL
jgi:hypothetical protein